MDPSELDNCFIFPPVTENYWQIRIHQAQTLIKRIEQRFRRSVLYIIVEVSETKKRMEWLYLDEISERFQNFMLDFETCFQNVKVGIEDESFFLKLLEQNSFGTDGKTVDAKQHGNRLHISEIERLIFNLDFMFFEHFFRCEEWLASLKDNCIFDAVRVGLLKILQIELFWDWNSGSPICDDNSIESGNPLDFRDPCSSPPPKRFKF